MTHEIIARALNWPRASQPWDVLLALWLPITASFAVATFARGVRWWERTIWAVTWVISVPVFGLSLALIDLLINGFDEGMF